MLKRAAAWFVVSAMLGLYLQCQMGGSSSPATRTLLPALPEAAPRSTATTERGKLEEQLSNSQRALAECEASIKQLNLHPGDTGYATLDANRTVLQAEIEEIQRGLAQTR